MTTSSGDSQDPLPLRITVLISGGGTNLQALIDATTSPTSPYPALHNVQIIRVISNKKTAYGLQRATAASIPTAYHNLISGGYTKRHPHEESGSSSKGASAAARQAYDADLAALVSADEPDLVVCAGFMHILSPSFLSPLESRTPSLPVINLHPALPGRYNGIDAIARAWRDFQEGKAEGGRTGVMVHYVIEDVDMGEVVVEKEVEMRVDEALEGLEERMHKAEWEVIVEGTAKAVDRVRAKKAKGNG